MSSSRPGWIWQAPAWPEFRYDRDAVSAVASQARLEQGVLLGKAGALGAQELPLTQRDVWAEEAVSTAAIEGESLDLAAVRSSVARRLGISSTFAAAVPRNVEALLDVMEDATADWTTDLSDERLCRWQAALFHGGQRDAQVPGLVQRHSRQASSRRHRARRDFACLVRVHPSVRRRQWTDRPRHRRYGAGTGRAHSQPPPRDGGPDAQGPGSVLRGAQSRSTRNGRHHAMAYLVHRGLRRVVPGDFRADRRVARTRAFLE